MFLHRIVDVTDTCGVISMDAKSEEMYNAYWFCNEMLDGALRCGVAEMCVMQIVASDIMHEGIGVFCM